MTHESRLPTYQKKVKISLPKSLSIKSAWQIVGPMVVEKISGPEYSPVPYCFDTKAYKIGHIFVQTASQVKCFCSPIPVLKVLGPICDFVVRSRTSAKWLDKEIHTIKTSGGQVDFRVVADGGKNTVTFTCYDSYFLTKAPGTELERGVTISRSTHEDLGYARWFGMITGVLIAKVFEFNIIKDLSARTLYIGGGPHTILLKYEICEMDDYGTVIKSTEKRIPCKWQSLQGNGFDSLPLPDFKSQSSRLNIRQQR